MKNLLLFLSLFFVADLAFGQGDAPPFVQGQAQASKSVATIIQVPNSLATKTSASKTLIETGNKNILANPSFEAVVNGPITGWAQTGIVSANVETTVVFDGKSSIDLSSPNQALDYHQDSTLYQAQFADGPQGLAMMRVKTTCTDAPIYVCPRTAGAYPSQKTSGCVQVQPTGKWKLYKIPFLLGGTSNGIGITSNGSAITCDTYIDDAFVGAVDLKVDSNPVGPWIDYGAMTITATTTAPTKATTREKDNVRCRVNGQDYECIYEYRAASATGSAIGSGGYIFNLPSGVAIDTNYQYTTTNRNTFSAYDGLKAAASIGFGDIEYTGNGDTGGKCDVFATSSTTFQSDCFFGGTSVWMVSSSEAPVINQANAGLKFQIKFKGAGLSSNYSAYSTTNADYGFSPCALTGSWVTNATYTALCKRSGEMLRVKGKVAVTGAPTAAALTLTIPNSLTIDANKIPAADKEILGHGGYVVSGVNSYRAGAYYNSSTTVAIETLPASSAQNHVQAAVSNTSPFTFASGDYVSFDFEVPVSGWDQTSVAIGQFNGLESCADSYQCEGTYSAKVVASTGGVSDENLDWIAGNCTTANPSVCTFKTGLFTTTPNCTATMVIAASGQIASIDAQSATSVSVRQSQSAGLSANPFNLVCQKAGVDAVFKTARAVASDKNIQSIGSTGVDTQVVHFGGGADCGTVCSTGNCTICNQTGTKITSVSWIATGEYNLNGIDGTKYSCTGSAETSQYSGLIHKRNLSSSTFAKMRTGTTSTANGASATAICIGTP